MALAARHARATAWCILALAAATAACSSDASEAPTLPPDILGELNALDGMQATLGPEQLAGARVYHLTYRQPTAHDDPSRGSFDQRMTLVHRGASKPTVVTTTGYFLSVTVRDAEVTALLGANQLAIEERFFGPSTPAPPAWEYLTIAEAAADHHSIIAALKSEYRGAWISTGASKGGMASLFHRRFYPDDVDGTVAYVAPLMHATATGDPRFPPFLATVGDDACRARLASLQHDALARRTEILPVMGTWATAKAQTFAHLGMEKAFEISVLEAPFALFQYHALSDCDAVPAAGASAEDVFAFLNSMTDIANNYSDANIDEYAAYWQQSFTQLGYPQVPEAHLADVQLYPGADAPASFAPVGAGGALDPGAMADVSDWLARDGARLIFVYGANDPWSAAAVELGDARDSYRFFVAGGNHGSKLAGLNDADRAIAYDALARWARVDALLRH